MTDPPARLRASEESYRLLFEHSPLGIYRASVDGTLLLANPAMLRMLGYRKFDEMEAAATERGVYASVEERARFHEALFREGEVVGFDTTWLRKDGTPLRVRENAVLIRDGDGTAVRYEGTAEDVTERMAAEQKLAEYARELERSNDALEEFARVSSHDLQEPLRKILAFGDRLAATQAERLDERGRDYLARMVDAAARMQTLINDLLLYSRASTAGVRFQDVPLGEIVVLVARDLETVLQASGARLEVGALPVVRGDRVQLRQLVQNLLSNAIKYRRPGTPPLVRVHGLVEGPAAELRVQDEGIGFQPEHAERIFGLFERLHGRGEYEGTGIGLALCRKIVERHGGTIRAESVPGSGSTFVVRLPAGSRRTLEDP